MKMTYFFISTFLFLGISCHQEVDKTLNVSFNEKEQTGKELKTDAYPDKPEHEEFVHYILNDRIRKHDFEYVVENCSYYELFPIDGLEEIIAFSDKNYPTRVNPTYYEHFILFCFKYATSNLAKQNFDKFYHLTQLDTTIYDAVEQAIIEKHEKIKAASKPGAFIVQKNEWIYSLVETCRETPIGGNWVDYENLFLYYIGNNQKDSLIVLNADCGTINYRKEKRPTQHGNKIQCYEEKLLWSMRGNNFTDTIIEMKNYTFQNDNRRVICDDLNISRDILELVWNSKYLETFLKYQERLNYVSILEFKAFDQNSVIASYYISKRESKETVEMKRFKITDGKIKSINTLPGIQDVFINVEDYDNNNNVTFE